MTENNHLPDNERSRADLASQIANVAAQVSTTMRSGDQDECDALEAKLGLAQDRLQQKGAPPGLIPFIDVMRGMLRGEDVSDRIGGLPMSYRAVYEQIVDDLRAQDDERQLTVREVTEEVTHNVILAIKHGTFDQRRQMADTLFVMAHESSKRPDLTALRHFLTAAHILLQGGDPSSLEVELQGPCLEKWQEILNALR